MPDRMSELALKKRMLRQRSEVLRLTLAVQVNAKVEPLLGLADRAVSTGRWMGRHPYWMVAAAVALSVWRPLGVVRLASRGLWLWQTWQRLQPVVVPLLLRWTAPREGTPTDSKDKSSTKA